MARIKVNGRYYDVDDIVLEIPDVCSVDFMNGTVTKYHEKTQGRIEGRLIVLLNYLYHRTGYTSVDTIINDLYDGYAAEGSVKTDINNLRSRIGDRKLDDGSFLIIKNERGRGYRLMLPSPNPTDYPEDDEGTVAGGGGEPTLPPDVGDPPIKAVLIRMRTGELYPVETMRFRIGSSTYQADMVDIVLAENRSINRVHAEILCGGKYFFLRDPNPRPATQVGGHLLAEGESVKLDECTELILGDELFFFLSGSAMKYIVEAGMACAICSRDSGETKLMLDTPIMMDRHHPWRQDVLKNSRISRSSQAKLYRKEGRSFLVDMGSKNGTFCNKLRLVSGEAVALRSGDSISIVDTVFSYYEVSLVQGE